MAERPWTLAGGDQKMLEVEFESGRFSTETVCPLLLNGGTGKGESSKR